MTSSRGAIFVDKGAGRVLLDIRGARWLQACAALRAGLQLPRIEGVELSSRSSQFETALPLDRWNSAFAHGSRSGSTFNSSSYRANPQAVSSHSSAFVVVAPRT